jgi:hypothetical protein
VPRPAKAGEDGRGVQTLSGTSVAAPPRANVRRDADVMELRRPRWSAPPVRREDMRLRHLVISTAAIGAAHAAAIYLFRSTRTRYAGSRRHVLVTQGGTQLRASHREMDDAVVSVLMGGALLDYRQADFDHRPERIDALVIMGGLQVVVPPGWNVRVEADVTMGGIRDMRPDPPDGGRPADLVITGQVVMGGLEIRGELPAVLDTVRRFS